MATVKETVELTVPKLCFADEAWQIEDALSRLEGVAEVRTALGVKKAIIAYDPSRTDVETIRPA